MGGRKKEKKENSSQVGKVKIHMTIDGGKEPLYY
jgi:hypothetical protein